jgi:hypothetical protein
MHALGDPHDTPRSTLAEADAGLGVAWMLHVVPFQCSASVGRAPVLAMREPTAVHDAGAMHDTPTSSLKRALGFGAFWSDQPEPSQRSASSDVPVERLMIPTAVQFAGVGQDTPWSWVNCPRAPLAAVCKLQPVASSRTASGAPIVDPTAVHPKPKELAAHETAVSVLWVPPFGSGAGWRLHRTPFEISASVCIPARP